MIKIVNLKYLSVKFNTDSSETISYFFKQLHSFNTLKENKLGVLPEKDSLFSLRVFGEASFLHEFKNSISIRKLTAFDVFVSEVQDLPEIKGYAGLIRDTAANKLKPSYRARQERNGIVQPPKPKINKKSDFFVSLYSSSTKQSFSLKMKKIEGQANNHIEFNTYGLCKKDKGLLPVF